MNHTSYKGGEEVSYTFWWRIKGVLYVILKKRLVQRKTSRSLWTLYENDFINTHRKINFRFILIYRV